MTFPVGDLPFLESLAAAKLCLGKSALPQFPHRVAAVEFSGILFSACQCRLIHVRIHLTPITARAQPRHCWNGYPMAVLGRTSGTCSSNKGRYSQFVRIGRFSVRTTIAPPVHGPGSSPDGAEEAIRRNYGGLRPSAVPSPYDGIAALGCGHLHERGRGLDQGIR